MWGAFLTGAAIGVGVTLALTSDKAEEFRNELQDQAEDRINQWRRKGRRSIAHVQDIVEKSGDTISRVVDTTQSALDAISLNCNQTGQPHARIAVILWLDAAPLWLYAADGRAFRLGNGFIFET